MAEPLHTSASHDPPPWFTNAPGESDVLMIGTAVFLAVFVLMVGLLYFRLHHLPEKIAGKGKKVQLELVAVLGLIAMFTHYNIFWIAALLLAFIDIPDFVAPLRNIAGSTAKMAQEKFGMSPTGDSSEASPPLKKAQEAGGPQRETRLVQSVKDRADTAVFR